jgi:hypothetical protein
LQLLYIEQISPVSLICVAKHTVYISILFLLIIMEFEKLCNKVFSLHDDIRYVGVINDAGSLVAGGMRKGLDSITEEQTDELYLAQTALRKSMRQRFDDTMGKARFAYVEREKISMLTFYMDKNVLVVSIEPNVDSHTVMDIAKDTMDLLNGKLDY